MTRKHWGFIFSAIFIISLAIFAYLMTGRTNDSSDTAGFLAADKDYGVTLDLPPHNDTTLQNNISSLRENNLQWIRLPLNWADIESTPGEFNWDLPDSFFDTLEKNNPSDSPVKLIAVLQTTPAWAKPNNTPVMTPPLETSDFGRFARALAQRYNHQIDAYQIWHEPNLSANWGHTYVNAQQYAGLLREASLNIKDVDAQAVILSAALAPTLENGPLNLNELTYLDQLYQAQGNRWFDVVAGQAYGFDTEPTDPPHSDTLNFRRLELLRQVMLTHHDVDTPIWATSFGWNALPANWQGQPSPWKSNTSDVQAQRTTSAIAHARQHWPWLGPLLAVRWDADGLADDDPARGFALTETPQVLQAIQSAASKNIATPGRYPANHSSGQYSPGWRFALTHADTPRHEPRTLTIPFEGTRLDLAINRGPYRGFLWVTIDEQPANALPQNAQGNSYVVLYDPLYGSDTITLGQNLPYGHHQAVIKAEGGWGQWAISGWTIYNETNTRPSHPLLILLGAIAVGSTIGLLWSFWPGVKRLTQWSAAKMQTAIAAYNKLGDPTHIAITLILALGFYIAPDTLALLLLPLLALAIFLRPDLGLMVIVLSLSFFLAPKQLPIKSFSPVELGLILTAIGFIFREALTLGTHPFPSLPRPSLRSMDWAALALTVLALLSTLVAPNFGVSMHEWRLVIVESVLFYFLVRLGRDYGPQPAHGWRWAWRLVDAFIAGATLHALLALYLYFFTNQSITAEGVYRALGPVYGSPNNLSLFLDRAWPVLLAVAFFPGQAMVQVNKIRRGLYGVGLIIVSLTLYLTFSKGALLVALPAAVIGMTLLYALQGGNRKKIIAIGAGCLALLGLALIPLSQTPRFRTTFDLSQGSTGFFRLKLWESSLNMLRDRWPLGVGLDNFLYQYRTRYILPEAWQEPNLSHPHNIILDFGTRLGLGGIGWLLWTQITFWRNAWQLYQKTPTSLVLGLMGSMIIFLAHGLVDNAFFLVDLAFVFFLIVGLVQKLNETSAKNSTDS